jgi:mRNA interferase RelE/StbE
MASYRIEFRRSVERDLRRIERDRIPGILAAMEALKEDPRPNGVKKLRGTQATWRLRVGDYRIIYEIEDDLLRVLVVRIAHRRDVYRE